MRSVSHSKTDWVDIKLKGAVMHLPVQKDSSSCGVIVTMVRLKLKRKLFLSTANMLSLNILLFCYYIYITYGIII